MGSTELNQNESAMSLMKTRPTRVRWRIMTMTTLTSAVAIFGRVNLGVLGKHIQDEFGFSTQTMGWIFSAFAIAYHSFQIPGGWAGDRYPGALPAPFLPWFPALPPLALPGRQPGPEPCRAGSR